MIEMIRSISCYLSLFVAGSWARHLVGLVFLVSDSHHFLASFLGGQTDFRVFCASRGSIRAICYGWKRHSASANHCPSSGLRIESRCADGGCQWAMGVLVSKRYLGQHAAVNNGCEEFHTNPYHKQ